VEKLEYHSHGRSHFVAALMNKPSNSAQKGKIKFALVGLFNHNMSTVIAQNSKTSPEIMGSNLSIHFGASTKKFKLARYEIKIYVLNTTIFTALTFHNYV